MKNPSVMYSEIFPDHSNRSEKKGKPQIAAKKTPAERIELKKYNLL